MAPVSVIVPVRNDAACLEAQEDTLRLLREKGCEVIVVDGESTDDSAAVGHRLADQVISTAPGRARQMNAGAAAARGQLLLFLHADTGFPPAAVEEILCQAERPGRADAWGRFDVRLRGEHWYYRLVEILMNARSRITGIATGDQAIFVSRELFHRAGGYPDIPLMEDITLSRTLRRIARPRCLRQRVAPSTRRWHEHGMLRTTLLMWRLRLAYFFGISPERLARIYHGQP